MRFWCFLAGSLFAALGGCAHTPTADRSTVSGQVEQRTGRTIGPVASADKMIVPAGLDLGRKLSEDEVVVVALWNNPLFQEVLVDLQLTRADLVQAGLLPNPEAAYFFQAPGKTFKYAVELPIEALWLRPIRLKIARQENDRAAERLVQAALDLIRDARHAYADVRLARERGRIAQEALKLRGRIAELADARLKAGDASVQEASAAKIDAMLAAQDAVRIGYERPLAEARLRNLLGLGGIALELALDDVAVGALPELNADALAAEALDSRPDLLSASHAVAAAQERLRLARLGWVRFLGLLDATSGQRTGHEFGPGLRMTLPIFNRNQGGIARAEGELEQLERRRVTLRNQIELDVRQAHLRYRQARAELELSTGKTRPEVDGAIRRAEKAFKDGAASYLIVLESTRQLIDTLNREAQLHADLRRAWAEFERAVGRRILSVPLAVEGPEEKMPAPRGPIP